MTCFLRLVVGSSATHSPSKLTKKGLQLFVWAAIRGGAVRELPNHPIIQFNYSFSMVLCGWY
jgi:hypothetical protein